MPELPEVETVCRGLAEVMEGRVLRAVRRNRADLRFPFPPDFVERLTGRRVTGMGRRAKYILVRLEGGGILIVHLGMSGRFTIRRPETDRSPGRFHHDAAAAGGAHDHVVFDLDDDTRIVYTDPRRFGFMLLTHVRSLDDHPMIRRLGVEPLGNELTPDALAAAFRGRKTSLKAALLDQKIIAGVGNIYACEALFRAGLSPRRLAGTVCLADGTAGVRAGRLADAVRSVLTDAIRAGGSSLRDYARADGELGYFQHGFAVYGREGGGCPRDGCHGTVRRIVQNNRSTFYCPACQR